jgi:hypothetical protein
MALDTGQRFQAHRPPQYGTAPGTAANPADMRLRAPTFDLHRQAGLPAGTPTNFQGVPVRPVDRQVVGQQRATQFYEALFGPQMAQNDVTTNSLLEQIGFAGANQQRRTGYLNEDFASGNQRLDVQRDALGVDRGANQRNLGYLDQLEGFANRLLGVQTQDAWAQAGMAQRQAKSSATARGAMNSPGIGRTMEDITGQLDRTGQSNQLGFDRELANINNQRSQTKDQAATLDLRARELGLDRADLQRSLDRGIEQLNLDTFLSTNDLLDAMASNDINRRMIAEEIFRNAMDSSDIFASMPATQFRGQMPRTQGVVPAAPSGRVPGSRGIPLR